MFIIVYNIQPHEGIRGVILSENPQHPLFNKYKREWLSEVTGFSKQYLCRVATGRVALSRSFIERVCFKLGEPEEALFLPDAAEASSAPGQGHKQQ